MYRLFMSLTVLERLVIFISIVVVPAFIEFVQGWQATGFCPSCVSWITLASLIAWYVVAALLIAWATKQDRTKVDARIDREATERTASISQLSEDHRRKMAGLQNQVADLHSWVRIIDRAMREE